MFVRIVQVVDRLNEGRKMSSTSHIIDNLLGHIITNRICNTCQASATFFYFWKLCCTTLRNMVDFLEFKAKKQTDVRDTISNQNMWSRPSAR